MLGAVAVLASLLVLATPSSAPAAPSGASRFVPLPPARVLDTRNAVGASGAVPPGGTLDLTVVGAGGVPASGVSAVVLNVTATETQGPGYITVYPTGQPGSSSNLNIETPGQTIANLVVVPVSDKGQVSFFTLGGTHFIADVFGYYTQAQTSAGGRYMPISPDRLLDTRSEQPGRLGAGQAVTVQVAGRAGVPSSGASAAVLNITLTEANPGFVQVIPDNPATNQARFGTSSNLNAVRDGQTIPNLVMVPLGDNGAVTIYSERGTHLIVDVIGWYTNDSQPVSDGGLFVPVTPNRLLETRGGPKPGAGSITKAHPLGQVGVPGSGVAAILGNLTATQADPGWVAAIPGVPGSDANPALQTIGRFSNVNIDHADQTIPNAVVANLGSDGSVDLYTFQSAYLLLDVAGYFTLATPATEPTPTISLTGPSGVVRGNLNLTASTTGSGILGVQFKVDGNNVGPEDTVAPFSTTWVTAANPNADHTITAVMRLAGRPSVTSAPASVQVRNALVSLTFDDGTDNHLYAAQRLQAHGMVGTFYLIGNYLDDRNVDGVDPAQVHYVNPPYLRVEQAQAIKAMGNEIGAHTMDHCSLTSTVNTGCTHFDGSAWPAPLTATEVQDQLQQAKDKLNNWGLGPITNFASPFGDMNGTVLPEVQSRYVSHRGVDEEPPAGRPYGGLMWPGMTQWDIKAKNVMGIDNVEPGGQTTTPAIVNGWLDELTTQQAGLGAGTTPMWMTIVFHEIADTPHFAPDYSMNTTNFEGTLNALQARGVRVVTVQQALQETGRI
jgi:peptidoglycan/xylan/chitin deacetylase (PgdA/CDA1 family)